MFRVGRMGVDLDGCGVSVPRRQGGIASGGRRQCSADWPWMTRCEGKGNGVGPDERGLTSCVNPDCGLRMWGRDGPGELPGSEGGLEIKGACKFWARCGDVGRFRPNQQAGRYGPQFWCEFRRSVSARTTLPR